MELYAKGQLSFLILNCLLERDFYGLDIISEISDRSNGSIQLKKPSVYSNLTRMEKQSYVSSYLRSSDLGPNRKYYSITEKGREFYRDLKEYYDRNNIDVFRDFNELEDNSNQNKKQEKLYSSTIQNNADYLNKEQDDDFNETIDNSIEESDFFDFSSIDDNDINNINTINLEQKETQNKADEALVNKENETIKNNIETDITLEDNEKIIYNEENNFTEISTILESNVNKESATLTNNNPSSFLKELHNINNANSFEENIMAENKTNELQEENQKDDAVFLSNKDATEYNKRLYDISKEINRYKRKRSFAEDQISISVNSPLSESNEKTKANIEDFKNSILDNKNRFGRERLSQEEFYNRNLFDYKEKHSTLNERNFSSSLDENNKIENEIKKDDAVFITQRISSDNVEHAKRIEPPRLKIIPESSKDTRLPAPKRDTTIDPSHKEILSRLYSRTKDNQSEEIREDALYDYSDLKDFYKNQNISFNVYKKPSEKKEHNTNKIYLIISCISFLVASLLSTILYVTFLKTENLNNNTTFLYILLPSLFIIDVILKFYNYKKYKGKIPSQILPQWQIWCYTLLSIGCVVGLNFICGFNGLNFELYATTLVLPLAIILVLLPIRYYLKRIILVKYWR